MRGFIALFRGWSFSPCNPRVLERCQFSPQIITQRAADIGPHQQPANALANQQRLPVRALHGHSPVPAIAINPLLACRMWAQRHSQALTDRRSPHTVHSYSTQSCFVRYYLVTHGKLGARIRMAGERKQVTIHYRKLDRNGGFPAGMLEHAYPCRNGSNY